MATVGRLWNICINRCNRPLLTWGQSKATYVEKPISEKIAHDNEPKYKESNEEIAIWEMKKRIKALREQGLPESPD